ncbi:MAG: NmrA family NAD(P)-binding protein, partial [Acidobacteriales bacterium]|nr:NmrA family NAD(P)-binding protein [Terriglobales bacterium]
MIVVLGASGNIGSATVESLKARGAKFRAGYRTPQEVTSAKNSGIDAVQADYSDITSLERAFDGADRVFFVNPPTFHLLQFETNILNAAKRAGVKLLVKSSVWGAETDEFIFAHPHRASEKQIEASGVPYTFIRPNGFFQNILASKPLIESQGFFAEPEPDTSASEVDTRDIGAVVAAVLTGNGHEGKNYK